MTASTHGQRRWRITATTDLRIAEAPDREQVRRALAWHGGPYITPPGGPTIYTKDLREDLWPGGYRCFEL
jgi:hypothetical protein